MSTIKTTEYKPINCDECFLRVADDVSFFCILYEQHTGESLGIKPDFCKIVAINISEELC